jgi:hypothetical protein
MATWKSLLLEGKTYYMRNFRVFDNSADYKVTTHSFRLTCVNATRIQQVDIAGIPPTKFNFKDFTEILSGKYKTDYLVGIYISVFIAYNIGSDIYIICIPCFDYLYPFQTPLELFMTSGKWFLLCLVGKPTSHLPSKILGISHYIISQSVSLLSLL